MITMTTFTKRLCATIVVVLAFVIGMNIEVVKQYVSKHSAAITRDPVTVLKLEAAKVIDARLAAVKEAELAKIRGELTGNTASSAQVRAENAEKVAAEKAAEAEAARAVANAAVTARQEAEKAAEKAAAEKSAVEKAAAAKVKAAEQRMAAARAEAQPKSWF